MTRRTFVFATLAAARAFGVQTARFAYVGCYTTAKRHGHGDGIHVYRVDGSGAWTHVQHLGGIENPSFLILSRNQRFLYAVHGDGEFATAFSVDPATGQIKLLNRGATGGVNGVRQGIDRSGKYMVVANYGSGNVAVLPVKPDGSLADFTQRFVLEGKHGPDPVEQTSSHPHDVVFDPAGRFVIIPDKGLDRLFAFRFQNGKLVPTSQGSLATKPGAGPRHAAFHPRLPVLWVANELNSTVSTYQFDGTLSLQDELSSLPPDFKGTNTAAEITVTPDGRYVYCSNRGHDSVAVFAVDRSTGRLRSVGWTSTHGRQPRFIGLDPAARIVYAANELGDTIVPLAIDPATGKLTESGATIHNLSPTTIAFSWQ